MNAVGLVAGLFLESDAETEFSLGQFDLVVQACALLGPTLDLVLELVQDFYRTQLTLDLLQLEFLFEQLLPQVPPLDVLCVSDRLRLLHGLSSRHARILVGKERALHVPVPHNVHGVDHAVCQVL